jgi:response regulator of citrate/malate metabolism
MVYNQMYIRVVHVLSVMTKERGSSGEYVESVTLSDVLEVFDTTRGPVVLSADVAAAENCSRETARRKLNQLYERGDLARRKVSNRVLYWRPADETSGRRDSAKDPDTDSSLPTIEDG